MSRVNDYIKSGSTGSKKKIRKLDKDYKKYGKVDKKAHQSSVAKRTTIHPW